MSPLPPFLTLHFKCEFHVLQHLSKELLLCREQTVGKQGYQLMLKTECNLFGVVESMSVLRNRAAGKQRDAVILAFR